MSPTFPWLIGFPVLLQRPMYPLALLSLYGRALPQAVHPASERIKPSAVTHGRGRRRAIMPAQAPPRRARQANPAGPISLLWRLAAWRRRGPPSRHHQLGGEGWMELIEVRVGAGGLRNDGETGLLLEGRALELPVLMPGGPRHDEVRTGVFLNPDHIGPGSHAGVLRLEAGGVNRDRHSTGLCQLHCLGWGRRAQNTLRRDRRARFRSTARGLATRRRTERARTHRYGNAPFAGKTHVLFTPDLVIETIAHFRCQFRHR